MTDTDITSFAERLVFLRGRIHKACHAVGRKAEDVTLIGVCKRQPDQRIDAALHAGLADFGENRVQEAAFHWQAGGRARPHLHLVGSLQSNKAEDAVRLFDVVHALDRVSLAHGLAAAEAKFDRKLCYFIQVNTGLEPQKSGCKPGDLAGLLHECRDQLGLNVIGLMCLPPVNEPPESHFAALAELGLRLGLPSLSMGMSDDFEAAIAYGATHIRVGSLLFGARQK
jgi:PLP dependent protein